MRVGGFEGHSPVKRVFGDQGDSGEMFSTDCEEAGLSGKYGKPSDYFAGVSGEHVHLVFGFRHFLGDDQCA